MTRREAHFDAMLRHLGAAYYQTLHGQGTAADVARAVEAVHEFEARNGTAGPGAHGRQLGPVARPRVRHRGRWRVRDVMTTNVVTARRTMSYKQVARLMTEHKVNAIPVVAKNGHLLGMVSEADVLRKEERKFRRLVAGLSWSARRDLAKARAGTVAELMTSPAITIHPDAPLGAAARIMNAHHIRRLPVLDAAGDLIGIVSRRDLLSVFLRPDAEIAAEVESVLADILLEDSDRVTTSVQDGVVTLSGALSSEDMAPVAVQLASDVAGVVSVVNHLTSHQTPTPAPAE
ncbi:MAG TPA: CBS domain-containing protein [Streptosporangiaceae bacterium]